MKKTLLKLFTTSFIILSFTFSAFAQETTPEQTDSYQADEIQADEYTDTAAPDEYIETSSEEVTVEKKSKAPLIYFGNTGKFLLTDEMSVFLPKNIKSVTQKVGTYTYNPKERTAGFGCQIQLGYYIVQLNDKGRKYFIQSLDSYLRDFENKKLNRKDKKSYRNYGQSNAKLWWGSMKTSTPNNTNTKCWYGYTFMDNSPYFCITVTPGLNEYFLQMNQDKDFADPESKEIKIYFTKAQAKALAERISDETVNQLFSNYELSLTGGELLDSDNY